MAESRYRDELESAIEPFKGLLLGLFFVAIGMSVNLHVVEEHWKFILAGVAALLLVKAAVLYGFARFLGLPRYHRLLFAMVLAQGGEFSFAIFNEAWDNHLMDLSQRDVLAVSMGLVPILIKLLERVPERLGGMADLPGVEPAPGAAGGEASDPADSTPQASRSSWPDSPPAPRHP